MAKYRKFVKKHGYDISTLTDQEIIKLRDEIHKKRNETKIINSIITQLNYKYYFDANTQLIEDQIKLLEIIKLSDEQKKLIIKLIVKQLAFKNYFDVKNKTIDELITILDNIKKDLKNEKILNDDLKIQKKKEIEEKKLYDQKLKQEQKQKNIENKKIEQELKKLELEKKVVDGLLKKFINKNGVVSYIPIISKENYSESLKLKSVKYSGANSPTPKLSEENVIEIRNLYAKGNITQKELSKMFNIDYTTVNKIIKRRLWKHLE